MTTAWILTLAALAVGSLGEQPPAGYWASPKLGRGPAVLVLHAWWGLNQDVRRFCDRLAKEGFLVFAPDLFQGRVARTIPEAETLVNLFEPRHLELEAKIAEATTSLLERSKSRTVSAVGFSFGAYYALAHSNADSKRVSKVVVFYGTGHEDFSKSRANYLGHFAEKDSFEPKEGVENLAKLLKASGRQATIHTYPGTGHWFFEPSRRDAYNKAAAELAWKRTIAFLKS